MYFFYFFLDIFFLKLKMRLRKVFGSIYFLFLDYFSLICKETHEDQIFLIVLRAGRGLQVRSYGVLKLRKSPFPLARRAVFQELRRSVPGREPWLDFAGSRQAGAAAAPLDFIEMIRGCHRDVFAPSVCSETSAETL